MSMPFEIFRVFVRLWYSFRNIIILQLIHIYINTSTCEGFYVTDKCLRVVFSFPTLLRIWMNQGEGFSISLIGATVL